MQPSTHTPRRAIVPMALCLMLTMIDHGRAMASAGPACPCQGDAPGSDANNDVVTVEATGRAETAREARKQAIAAAIRKVIGEYVDAEVIVENDEVISDTIISATNAGSVKSEQVGDPRVIGDEVEITMRVTLEPTSLAQQIEAALSASATVDGASIAAEIELAAENFEAQKALMMKVLGELPFNCLKVGLIDFDGKPLQEIDRRLILRDPETGQNMLHVLVRMQIDSDAWKQYQRTVLTPLFDAVATQKKPEAWRCNRLGKPRSGSYQLMVPVTGVSVSEREQSRNHPWDLVKLVSPRPQGIGSRYTPVFMESSSSHDQTLRFDLYWIDGELLAWLNRSEYDLADRWYPGFAPPELRIELKNDAGDAVGGRDVQCGRTMFACTLGVAPSQIGHERFDTVAYLEGAYYTNWSGFPIIHNGDAFSAGTPLVREKPIVIGGRWWGLGLDSREVVARVRLPIDANIIESTRSVSVEIIPSN